MKQIKYTKGYKYQLCQDYVDVIPIQPKFNIDTDFILLDMRGNLVIKAGYAWDGASGPTIDTDSSMRGSLVHDALYQLMRKDLLQMSARPAADRLLEEICIEDGMWKFRAKIWERMVRKFAVYAALPENDKKVYTAP